MEDVADVDEKRTQKGMRQRREDTDKAYQTIVDLELKARFAKTERLRLARENSEKALGQKAR